MQRMKILKYEVTQEGFRGETNFTWESEGFKEREYDLDKFQASVFH